jgi:hypothetical protein
MTEQPLATDPVPETADGSAAELVPSWLTLPDVAEALGLDVTRVRQAVRDRQVLAVRLEGVLRIPSAFVQDGKVLKGLPGLLTVLKDSGYSDEDALRWIFTPDDSLPGTPAEALRENRGREVRRRAQTLAW